ncbi:MAG: hypothetical protein SAK29_22685 [Scytonema sp. PMC 1069.18]|nr:hypothetical protein [Scytonema sp. PMC 1069.18]MEC4884026.1 hypothetical protein [Scytonema sp. PMC 1070.18]
MDASSRYWKIWRINPSCERLGYKHDVVSLARDFFKQEFPHHQHDNVEGSLFSYFHGSISAIDVHTVAFAGLCLRCYVSNPILKACRKIDNLFSTDRQFTYRDLLPFVLDDDGQQLILLEQDSTNQLVLDKNGKASTVSYNFFSVKILQTYNPNSQYRMSLDNWAYLQTKQHPELKKFLSEHGFQHLSDWALLNRVRSKQLLVLSQRDRHIVEVFHSVYRRDRQQQRSQHTRRCPDPSSIQLKEMLMRLQERQVIVNTTVELMKELRQIAIQFRQYDIWSYREPLEIQDPETGSYQLRVDLPSNSVDEVDLEHKELLEFLQKQLQLALKEAIAQEVQANITKLTKSKKYEPFAQKLISGLQLYYAQGLSLKDIAPKLGMTSWDQARRVLNPGELLNKVRILTEKQLLDRILKKAEEKGFTKLPPEPDYLRNLTEYVQAFLDQEVFTEAAEEIRAGKNRSMKSAYAQQLLQYLDQCS